MAMLVVEEEATVVEEKVEVAVVEEKVEVAAILAPRQFEPFALLCNDC